MIDGHFSAIVEGFLSRQLPGQRELVQSMTREVNANTPVLAAFFAEMGHEALKHNYGPIQMLKLGIMYGSVIGQLMEREGRRPLA